MHQFKLKGIACIIASFGDDFELSVKGVRFQKAYDELKQKSAFNWDTQKKHDPFQAKQFGEKIEVSTKATSREADIFGGQMVNNSQP